MRKVEEAYMVMQDACDIKVGDSVKVLRKAKDDECGWVGYWNGKMDKYVGENGVVDKILKSNISVSFNDNQWNFPFFVLEKIPKPHWRDTVSRENPALCYVKNTESGLWSFNPVFISNYHVDSSLLPYKSFLTCFRYAKRVPKSMIESMLKAYDETSEDE